MSSTIIDSHIHLWPRSAANPDSHAWMKMVPSLAKEHTLWDYRKASRSDKQTLASPVTKVIYIETDRRYTYHETLPIQQWASGPLQEIEFLKSIVEGCAEDAEMLAGIVLWAPMNRREATFDQWLELAEQTAGKPTWQRVRGFRFLLQALTSRPEFEEIVFSEDFIRTLKKLGVSGKGYTFDVGIDQHSGGVWQLEVWNEVLERVCNGSSERPTTFIMNHLCKPDMTRTHASSSAEFAAWRKYIGGFAKHPNVYMKISGAFSEMSDNRVELTAIDELAGWIRPWFDVIFEAFGPDRIMFGSDWPICNTKGPGGENSWSIWQAIVMTICDERGLTQAEKDRIFSGTANAAYCLACD